MENVTIHNKTVCTVKEFAKEFGLSMPTAYAVSEEPGFPLLRIGRKKLVITSGLQRWMQERAR